MPSEGALHPALVVMTTLGLVSSRVSVPPCSQVYFLRGNQEMRIDVTNQTTSQQSAGDCAMELKTIAEWRIVLTFDYKPVTAYDSQEQDCAYAPYYLLIGNDVTAIGQESLTSYKFCRETQDTEIVSRGSNLWLVLKAKSVAATRLRMSVKSLLKVSCGQDEMQCSPVQCVHRSQVCDGHNDCENGRDEYCYDFANITNRRLSHESRQHPEVALLPPEGSTCFLCRDGTCISPRLSRYDWRWGMWLWYLCDGVPHCPDAWDEQSYMCYLIKHFPGPSHLFVCEAFDLPAAIARQVRMWSLARCDERRDCRREEEEEGCEDTQRARTAELRSQLYVNPLTLSLVIAFTVITILSAAFVFHRLESSRRNRNETGRQPNSPQIEEMQSYLPDKSLAVDPRDEITWTDKAFESLRETVV